MLNFWPYCDEGIFGGLHFYHESVGFLCASFHIHLLQTLNPCRTMLDIAYIYHKTFLICLRTALPMEKTSSS